MTRAVVLACVMAAGCGRIDFAELPLADGMTEGPLGHDEDSDGIADAEDPCPHVASGGLADGDGDGVGDACDPNPTVPTESWMLFSPLTPGTNPFDDSTGFDQKADALHVVALGSAMNVVKAMPIASARLELGFDILAIAGTTMDQHQVAGGIEGTVPYYFVELNESAQGMRDVAIVSYDPANGYVLHGNVAHGGLHPGRGLVQFDAHAGSSPTFDLSAGWIGEMYSTSGPAAGYAGGSSLRWTINGLDIDLRYVAVIATP